MSYTENVLIKKTSLQIHNYFSLFNHNENRSAELSWVSSYVQLNHAENFARPYGAFLRLFVVLMFFQEIYDFFSETTSTRQ